MNLTLPTTLSPDAPDARVLLANEFTGSVELVFQWVSDDRHPISLALAWVHGNGGAYLAHGEGATPAEALLDLLADAEGDLEGTELSATAALALSDLAHEAVGRVCQQLCGEPLERAVFVDAPLLSVDECFAGVAQSYEETAEPEYQRCAECNCPLVVFHGETFEKPVCTSPYCSRGVELTEEGVKAALPALALSLTPVPDALVEDVTKAIRRRPLYGQSRESLTIPIYAPSAGRKVSA